MVLQQVLELIPEESLNSIKTQILTILDEKIKNRYYINKHFQNAIMNYFLEDYGSFYLRDQFDKQSNREVRRHLTCLAAERGYKGTKYMIMMNIYFDVHKSFNLVTEYRQLLKSVILQENTFELDSQEYTSHAWKKAFGLFVLAHTFDRNLNSIFDIWNSLFLDQKIYRKRRPNSKTSYSSQQKMNANQNTNKNNLKNNETESDDDSSFTSSNKEKKQKNNVKQEFNDQATMFQNENINQQIQNLKLNLSVQNTSNGLDLFKDQRMNSQNLPQPALSIFALQQQQQQQQQLQFPQNLSQQVMQKLLLQGQILNNQYPIQALQPQNSSLMQGAISAFNQSPVFVNPQQILLNAQSLLALQQQQQLIQQQYQQAFLLEQQKQPYNLMLASQIPQTIGSM